MIPIIKCIICNTHYDNYLGDKDIHPLFEKLNEHCDWIKGDDLYSYCSKQKIARLVEKNYRQRTEQDFNKLIKKFKSS